MKTKLELTALSYTYLNYISIGYSTGEFKVLFQHLAKDCVMKSQWVLTPNVGYDAVVSYLTGKGETLKKNNTLPSCSIVELVGNIATVKDVDINVDGEKKHGNVSMYYPNGELCLLMEQTLDGKSNDVILRIEINEDEKISRIDLCDPKLYSYRDFYDYVSVYPYNKDEELRNAEIIITEDYFCELYLFLDMVGVKFDECDDTNVQKDKWMGFLGCWKRFYSFKTFDEAFVDACGIDYVSFTVKDEDARGRLANNGQRIWDNRRNNSNMLKGLIEWTDKYKNICDGFRIYGW